jgi:adenosylmethionine-8-amino-7-oxononanoate aminotransferase
MTKTPNWYQRGHPHVWLPYTSVTAEPPLAVARTHGTRIVLSDGTELIDGIASWWTACHGYNHPHVRAKVLEQLTLMPHVMLGGLLHEPAATLCRRLADKLPGDLDHVFLSDSGSVAVEVAMKMAIQYWINQGIHGRTRFMSFRGGYHGDTFATMSVCDPEEGMHSLFTGVLTAQIVVDLPTDDSRIAAFEGAVAANAGNLAAILVEPLVQGAGGMLFHDAGVLRRLREVANRHGVLLIFDEIFTGFARTGCFFACESAGVVPDIITLGKALTAGTLPLAATVANERVYQAFCSENPDHTLMHGPTFMGNPLACAAANASLDVFESKDWMGEVALLARRMTAGLAPCRSLPGVKNVRVLGGIGVVELHVIRDLAKLKERFLAAGVWVRPFRSTVYVTPALNIGDPDLSQLLQTIERVLRTTP